MERGVLKVVVLIVPGRQPELVLSTSTINIIYFEHYGIISSSHMYTNVLCDCCCTVCHKLQSLRA